MKGFDHSRPVRDRDGAVIGAVSSPARARTVAALGHGYGRDRNKRLVVTLARGDVITLRPERTRRNVSIEARELYAWLVRLQAAKHAAEKKARRREKLKGLR